MKHILLLLFAFLIAPFTSSAQANDTIIIRDSAYVLIDCGGKFAGFLNSQGLKTNEFLYDYFTLTINKTKTHYWISINCDCRPKWNSEVTVLKNNKLVDKSELYLIEKLILENRGRIKEKVFKKGKHSGEIRYYL